MNKIALIPARYAATRFPAKLMQLIGGKPVIRYTYEQVVSMDLFDEVIVVTDSDIIFNEISSHGGKAVMSKKEHESGSDRIAEAIADMHLDVIINVQGDEPFIQREPLEKLLNLFDDPAVEVGSLMRTISADEAADPNMVKVVTDLAGNALYFSRSIIPFPRSGENLTGYHLHVGVYGYRKSALMAFTKWPSSPAERTEKLEQLRYLENGVRIRMASTSHITIAIDTPEDLERAREWYSKNVVT
jgi:3-deoxy-manno-octulosonate cytidylyltransferase (CMP-KDO synthetase)